MVLKIELHVIVIAVIANAVSLDVTSFVNKTKGNVSDLKALIPDACYMLRIMALDQD